ncbi:MAG: B12-binding domain-containing radical SAM protein [Nitrososphaerota archaeon]|nr:B12-binding domain-containing radical SAM protein [Nitrososphaerota archaeon]MDG6953468.1 B12-binding domain-containing radical SAM protein [Nitrososphaerota archaeon]
MAKYVLVSDTTLAREYNNFPLLDFLPCAPSGMVPRSVYNFLKGSPPPAVNGRALLAPYALRKLEAALLMRHTPEEVVVPHVDYIEEFVKEDTEVIGVYTMDPLGLGPLTMSYAMLFGDRSKPWVRVEFEELMARLNRAREGTRAKLVVGGPGVWELTVMPEVMDELKIDLAFQGEADDIINELMEDITGGEVQSGGYFMGFQSFDPAFRKVWVGHERFITRSINAKQFPLLDELPPIRHPTIKGLVEIMRGCGVGCDFCEVTLRPIRYYTPEMMAREVAVNSEAGQTNAWLHTDEIFAYQHGPHFTPNEDAILGIFRAAMSVKGISSSNPTHGRISIPAAYPELVKKVKEVVGAGPERWIGVQVGLETGSDRLAKVHMPNKTLPLRIGADGAWQEIALQGLANLNRAYWRPAFTVQVGQADETDEDNWDTVAMINRISSMTVDGRPSEFTVTPMQNVPLGLIKGSHLSSELLTKSQLAVYYASYRHLVKMVLRDSVRDSEGNLLKRMLVSLSLDLGGYALFQVIERICKKRGVDVEKVKNYGLARAAEITR